jgi:hypothetical protein
VDAKKRFGEIAHMKRIDFIKAKLIKETSLGVWQPFPITHEEANHQKAESSFTKSQILSIIDSLNPFLVNQNGHIFEAYQVNFRNDLVIIQEVRSINITGNNNKD